MVKELTLRIVEKTFRTKDTNEEKKYTAFVANLDGEDYEFVPKYRDDKAVIKHILRKGGEKDNDK